MKTSNPDSVQQQANDWLIKLETGGLADGEETLFVEWLEANDSHAEAFYEAEQTWQMMSTAAKAELSQSQQQGATVHHLDTARIKHKSQNINKQAQSPILTRYLPLAATFILTFMAMFFQQDIWFALSADHYTATGERRDVTLSDGTVISLNTDSAIELAYTGEKRLIKLMTGEIYVDVFPDKNRPLVVQAGEMQVTALGTEFIVRKAEDENPVVTVTEHSVKVESLQVTALQTVLEQGQQVRLLEQRDKLTKVEAIDVRLSQSWRDGKLIFKQEPLYKVVEELARYTDAKIIIRERSVKALKVTGVLNADTPLESLESLAKQLQLNFNKVTPFLIFIDKG